MGRAFEFLGEQVTGVNDARDVSDTDNPVVMELASIVFAKIDVLGAFVRATGSPVDG